MKLIFTLFFFVCLHVQAYACSKAQGTQEGQCAPNFSLASTDKRTFELKKFRGKVVVVNFWATWCEPCIDELPSLNRLYRKKIKDVEFVSVSIDSNQKAIDRFFAINKGIKVEFPILKDFDKKVADQWGTSKVPETYIINKKGEVMHKEIGIRDWDEGITSKYLKLLAEQ